LPRNRLEQDIEAQQRIIRELKREIFGIDKTSKSSYIKDFESQFDRYRKVVPVYSVLRKAASSDIVYFGDYHPLDESQEWVLKLMRFFADAGRRVVLALELLYVHQQEFLDRWMKGSISEAEFLEAIDYRSEWGFSWESFRRIFELAKDPFIPIFGIDSEPRDNLTFIRMRDRMIARRIRTIRGFFPEHLILVMIGESHLASNHLPGLVRKSIRKPFRELVIVQNVDSIFWRMRRRGVGDAEAVMIDPGRYCIFTASPVQKYQSYREIIHRWIGDDDEECRAIRLLEEMVEHIALVLVGERGGTTPPADESLYGSIEEMFPSVLSRATYTAVGVTLRSRRVPSRKIAAALEILRTRGMYYVPSINILLVLEFDPVAAALEAARFVLYALRGGLLRRKRRKHAEDRFYSFMLEEALVHFCSKIIHPTHSFTQNDPVIGAIDAHGTVVRAIPRHSLGETREVAALFKYHVRREHTGSGSLSRTAKLAAMFSLPFRSRLPIVTALAGSLGEAMMKSYLEGRVTREEILSLCRDSFARPGTAKRRYLEWVGRTHPFRGAWFTERRHRRRR
jgi:hypothetical protein